MDNYLRNFNKFSSITIVHPIPKPTMGRLKGAKCIPKEQSKTIYDMHCVIVHVCDIAKYYDMPRSTVSGIIRRLKKTTKTVKVQGHPLKLSECGKLAFKSVYWRIVSNHYILLLPVSISTLV